MTGSERSQPPSDSLSPVSRSGNGPPVGLALALFAGLVGALVVAGQLSDAPQPTPSPVALLTPVATLTPQPAPSPSSMPAPTPAEADLVGRLLVTPRDPECAFIVDGRQHWAVSWPAGYRIEQLDETASLVGRQGSVARMGDVLGLAGAPGGQPGEGCQASQPFEVTRIEFVQPRQRSGPRAAEFASHWQRLDHSFLDGISLTNVAAGESLVLALGRQVDCAGTCASVVLGSDDGLAWRELYRTRHELGQLVHFEGRFWALGTHGEAGPGSWSSVDGEQWQFEAQPEAFAPAADGGPADPGLSLRFSALAGGPAGLLALGRVDCRECPEDVPERTAVALSTDGREWQRLSFDQVRELASVSLAAGGPAGYLLAGYERAWSSADGHDWTRATSLSRLRGVVATNEGFLAAGAELHRAGVGLLFEPVEGWRTFGRMDTFVAVGHGGAAWSALAAMQYDPAVGADYAVWWRTKGGDWHQELLPRARVASGLDLEWAFPRAITEFNGHLLVVGGIERHGANGEVPERAAGLWIRTTPVEGD